MRSRHCSITVFVLLAGTMICAGAAAQELVPRAYWPAPVGTDVLVLGYQHNTGDIVIDPSLPVTGVESNIDYLQVSYQRSFDLFGRSASAQFSLPYAHGVTEGVVEGEFRRRKTVGLTDARFRLAVNLRGAPAMDIEGFQALRAQPRTIIGASLLMQAPTGEYDSDRLLNLGTNRWSLKPAIGMIVPLQKMWLFEIEVGAWLFGDNDDFLGETRVGSEFRDDLQRNSRAGLTLVFPVSRRHAIRTSFSTGISTRSGGDFEIYSLSYAYAS
jgi:hypothetical protein